jgi:hypothetical protein
VTHPITEAEREATPAVIAAILAVRRQPYPRDPGGVPLPVAVHRVAEAWWRDALASGLSPAAAQAVEAFVYRVGADLMDR